MVHAIAVGLIGLAGCQGERSSGVQAATSKTTATGRLKIVATTGMVADIVRKVVGSHADVTALMGSGVDPHLFKATRNHIKQLQQADVVFYSGLMLEGQMQLALEQIKRGRTVVAVTAELEKSEKEYLRSPPDFEGHYDPHVWMDVAAWSRCVNSVIETMSTTDPANAADYRENGDRYRAELAKLDDYVRTVIASIPASHRLLVTSHDAFGYFGRAYGIEVRSVQGVSTEAEAGIQDVNRLVDLLVERKLPAIFVETSVNEKNIRAAIEGARSRQVIVTIGGKLFSDAMGAEGTYEGTYAGMLDHNATQIALALGGTAPERGFSGRLGSVQP